jgi:hypothetical protein
MTRHCSTSLSLVLFSAGSHLRAANNPHANGALEGKGILTDAAAALTLHIVGQG